MRSKPSKKDFLVGFLRLVRTQNLLIIALTQLAARIFLIGPREQWRQVLADPFLYLIILSTLFIAAAGYIINDYFDIKIDIVNKPRRVIIGRYLKRRMAIGTHQVFNVLGVLAGLIVSYKVAIINVFSVSLLWLYAERYKRQPLIGNVAVSSLTALSLLILSVHYPDNRTLVVIYSVFAFFISLIREIVKDIEDIRGDAAHGCRTLPIVLGIRGTKQVLYVLIVIFTIGLAIGAESLHNQALTWAFAGLVISFAWLFYMVRRAQTKKDFGRISTVCKVIMLIGLLTMAFI
ncbi:geranylgeranylglycerol-phosphate geranylgeranyltransferase [Ravibacter arvi]|uniref:Geranylgeranylglycerol-phosphate geranylgeranyltransferase n=1 Tax=Ravibacter arvi TaxID=2051041 RepID=A0ABP8LW10_9BACT